jgi:hypothetical protein
LEAVIFPRIARGAKLPGSSTSFNDPSREAEKEVLVRPWARLVGIPPTGN